MMKFLRSHTAFSRLSLLGICLVGAFFFSWAQPPHASFSSKVSCPIVVGAERMDTLISVLSHQRVAVLTNASGVVGQRHTLLVDTLLSVGVRVVKIFSPEHGYRSTADAGKKVFSSVDVPTGLPIISLYGNHKKPTTEDLKEVDIVLLDLQDVGARFYTYISTMHYVMQACAEQQIPLLICDRPNPCDYVSGPLLRPSCRSFVGMHPIPLLHGLTMGELAQMINGEGWLDRGVQCPLQIITIENWRHGDPYMPPVPPSPNLRDSVAIRLYPSLCLFEATSVSVGRGTTAPFQKVGFPDSQIGKYVFTPRRREGAQNPMHLNKKCYGTDYSSSDIRGFSLAPFYTYFYRFKKTKYSFITRSRMLDLLIGDERVQTWIKQGIPLHEIEQRWSIDLEKYRAIRQKYLLYPDYR